MVDGQDGEGIGLERQAELCSPPSSVPCELVETGQVPLAF